MVLAVDGGGANLSIDAARCRRRFAMLVNESTGPVIYTLGTTVVLGGAVRVPRRGS